MLRVWFVNGANSLPTQTEDAGLCLHSVYRCNNCHNGSALQSAGETGAEESGVGASPARPNGQRRKVKRSFVGDRSSEFSRRLRPRPKRRRAKRGRSTRRAKTHSCLHRSKLGARRKGAGSTKKALAGVIAPLASFAPAPVLREGRRRICMKMAPL